MRNLSISDTYAIQIYIQNPPRTENNPKSTTRTHVTTADIIPKRTGVVLEGCAITTNGEWVLIHYCCATATTSTAVVGVVLHNTRPIRHLSGIPSLSPQPFSREERCAPANKTVGGRPRQGRTRAHFDNNKASLFISAQANRFHRSYTSDNPRTVFNGCVSRECNHKE